MASQDQVESTLRWVADEQHIHACAPLGENHTTVTEALLAQQTRVKVVSDYRKNLPVDSEDTKARDMSIQEAYSALEDAAAKRLHCLEDIHQISSLEPLFGKLTTEFANKASQLVEAESARAAGNADTECAEGVAQAAQSCILAVRANWCWISKLVKCADVHLGHVSDYHQFFHTAAEYSEWMPAELKKATGKVATQEAMNADNDEADQLHKDILEVLAMFLHWHAKTEALFDKSRKIMPIHLRGKKLEYARPVNALCDYKTREVTIRQGEDLTLLDNADSQSWKVKNINNTEAQVPAVVLVIPGPDSTAVKAAGNLRLQLLGIWTYNVKRIGKSLIWFMILCNKDWNEAEIKKLKAMTQPQKDNVNRCLSFAEETLCSYWADYKGFQELQTRVATLKEILAQEGDAADKDSDFSNALVLKSNTVEELLNRYKDLWSHWDTFRIICEGCNAPEFLLIVERWQQLKYMGMDELRSRWHTGFGFSDEDQDEFASWLERWLRTITTTTTVTEEVARAAVPSLDSTTSTIRSETLSLGQGEQFPAGSGSSGVVCEREIVRKSTSTVLESSAPGVEVSQGEEVVDGSGYSHSVTTTTTRTTRDIIQSDPGQAEMTVTKTERVYEGAPEQGKISGGDGQGRKITMTRTEMLGGAPGEYNAETTSDGSASTGGGSYVSSTSYTTHTSSSSSGGADVTLPYGDLTIEPQGATALFQSETHTETSSSDPGASLIKGGEGSYGSESGSTQRTTTTTRQTTTGDGCRDGGFSESTTTVVGGQGTSSEGSSHSQTVVTTSSSQSQVAGGGGYTQVTSQDEGSFRSGFSESSSRSGFSESSSTTTTSSSSTARQNTAQEIVAETTTDLGASMETATSEQITTSEQEEKRTFVITEEPPEAENLVVEEQEESKTFVVTGVMDPVTETEITMQEAVLKGIINSQTGCYCNTVTGESWPIPVAMNAGFIKVEFTTTKKTAEKRRDVGLITIKTQRESRPYTVKAVVDAKTERRLTVDEAITAGILDQQNGTYYNALEDQTMSLADAIDSNLLLVEYDRNAEVGEPETFTKTFAIHSVVDQQAKKTVSFSQAIRKGLLDRETAAYYHNITGEYTYVGDAIKRGFIKATVVKDPNSMDIDPENKLVVEQLQNIRKKLLNPMKAIATLRKAAAAEAGK